MSWSQKNLPLKAPPETQATLSQAAEARLRHQVPPALLVRPVVLAEVYRVLETPPPRMPPPRITPEPGHTPLAPASAHATGAGDETEEGTMPPVADFSPPARLPAPSSLPLGYAGGRWHIPAPQRGTA